MFLHSPNRGTVEHTPRRYVRVAGGLCLLLMVAMASGSEAPSLPQRHLRVCADPNNLPFSNERLEGFENKLADLIAHDLNATLTYT